MSTDTNTRKPHIHTILCSHSMPSEFFRRFSRAASERLGSSWSFIAAVAVVIFWAVTGPLFNYSNSWQLVINTGTTIVTFLMVFLIQNSQNRDAVAIHLKLDELIRALDQARNGMVDLENRSDEEIREVRAEFADLGNGSAAQRGTSETPTAEPTATPTAGAMAGSTPGSVDVNPAGGTCPSSDAMPQLSVAPAISG